MKVKLPVLPGEKFYTLNRDHEPIEDIVPDDYYINYGYPQLKVSGGFRYNNKRFINFSDCFSNKEDFEKVFKKYKEFCTFYPDRHNIPIVNVVEMLGMVIAEKEFEIPDCLESGDVVLLDGKKLTVMSGIYHKDEEGSFINYVALDENNQYVYFEDSDIFSKIGEKVDKKTLESRMFDAHSKWYAKKGAEQPERAYDIDGSEMLKALSSIGDELKELNSF